MQNLDYHKISLSIVKERILNGSSGKGIKVTLTYAQSINGKIGILNHPNYPISGPSSLILTHYLRQHHDAILVGIGTVLADNPSLTVRYISNPESARNPQPVILDSLLRVPVSVKLWNASGHRLWIVTSKSQKGSERAKSLEALGARMFFVSTCENGLLNLKETLTELELAGIKSLMVEGGSRVLSSFYSLITCFETQIILTISPQVLNGDSIEIPFSERVDCCFENMTWHSFAQDMVFCARMVPANIGKSI